MTEYQQEEQASMDFVAILILVIVAVLSIALGYFFCECRINRNMKMAVSSGQPVTVNGDRYMVKIPEVVNR